MISQIHRGRYTQHGRGLGGIFSSLFRVLKPLLSKSVSTAAKVGKRALKDKTLQNALSEMKDEGIKAGARVAKRKLQGIQKDQAKAVKRAKIVVSPHKKKKKKKNIFS